MNYFEKMVVGAVGLSLLGAGCNPISNAVDQAKKSATDRIVEKMIEGQTGGDVKINSKDGSVTIKDDKNGGTVSYGEEVRIPSDFPTEVPRYPGAKTILAYAQESTKQASLSQMTSDDVDKTQKWFEDTLKGQGYTREQMMDLGEGRILQYVKGMSKVDIVLTRSAGEDATGISTTFTKGE